MTAELTFEAEPFALFELESAENPRLQVVSHFSRYATTVARLPATERHKIERIARFIANGLRSGRESIRTIRLTGHADVDTPRRPAFKQQVARARAQEVLDARWRALARIERSSGGAVPPYPERVRWEIHSAGATRLVVPRPRTERDRARNRRVEIALVPYRGLARPAPMPIRSQFSIGQQPAPSAGAGAAIDDFLRRAPNDLLRYNDPDFGPDLADRRVCVAAAATKLMTRSRRLQLSSRRTAGEYRTHGADQCGDAGEHPQKATGPPAPHPLRARDIGGDFRVVGTLAEANRLRNRRADVAVGLAVLPGETSARRRPRAQHMSDGVSARVRAMPADRKPQRSQAGTALMPAPMSRNARMSHSSARWAVGFAENRQLFDIRLEVGRPFFLSFAAEDPTPITDSTMKTRAFRSRDQHVSVGEREDVLRGVIHESPVLTGRGANTVNRQLFAKLGINRASAVLGCQPAATITAEAQRVCGQGTR